jgi:ankyrin repeat protein
VATTLTNLGNAYGDLGDNAKKRDMLERALAIKERAYGPDHVALAITLWNLADANGDLGDTVKQREILERGLAINESFYGPDHSETVDFREALASLLHAAAAKGDVDAMTQLLDDGAAVDQDRGDGATPLIIACEKGHVDAARLLLERGAVFEHDSSALYEGDAVQAKYRGRKYYPGKVSRDRGNGKYDIAYDDGDNETAVEARLIRKLPLSPLAIAKENGHTAVVALLEESSRG